MLDAYFTSYFNAWLDNQNLYTGPKKVVTGFTPRLAMDPENRDRFFAAYPDGTLVAIVREPQSWYRSAVKYSPRRFPDAETAIGLWRESTEAALDERVVRSRTSAWSANTQEVMTAAGRADRDHDVAGAARADVQRPADPGEFRRGGLAVRDPGRRATGRRPTRRSPSSRVTCTSGP